MDQSRLEKIKKKAQQDENDLKSATLNNLVKSPIREPGQRVLKEGETEDDLENSSK